MAKPDDEQQRLHSPAPGNVQGNPQARPQAEDELREQAAWLRATLASIGDAVIHTDAEGCVRLMNPVAEALTGWSESEALGQPLPKVFRIVDERSRQSLENPALRSLREGLTTNLAGQTLLIAKDGGEQPIDCSAAPIRHGESQILGSILTFRDISERHGADAALRASEAFSRGILESSPDCVKVLDAQGNLLSLNPSGSRLMEIEDFGPYRGRPYIEFWPEESRPIVLQAMDSARTGKIGQFQGAFPTAKGTMKHWDVICAPVPGGAGSVDHFICVARDISEQKKTELALRESEQRFRLMADSAPVLIWVSAIDRAFTWFNRSWLDFVGRSMEQELGEGWAENIHPDDLDRYLETYSSAFDARREFSLEFRLRRNDGVYRWMLDRGTPRFEADGAFAGYIGSCVDISARIETEQELRMSEARLSAELDATRQLQEISSRLVQEGDIEQLYTEILDAARNLMRADMASIQDYDEERGALRLLASRGCDPLFDKLFAHSDPSHPSSCSLAWNSRERVIVPDVFASEFLKDPATLSSLRKCGIRAVQSTPLVSREGRVLGVIATQWRSPHRPRERELRFLDVLARQAADLIERREATQALHESGLRLAAVNEELRGRVEELQTLLNILPVGVFVAHDPECTQVTANTAGLEMLGIDLAQNVSLTSPAAERLSFRVLKDGAEVRGQDLPMQRAARTGESVHGEELDVHRGDGTLVTLFEFAEPLFDAEGAIRGCLGVFVDISDRKQAEIARAQLAAIIASSDDAIITKGLDGSITSWNRSAERMFGYSAAEAVGEHITIIVPPDRRTEEEHVLAQLRRGEKIDHFETERRTRDGRLLSISLSVSPVEDATGRIVGAAKVARDITARKLAEGALRESKAEAERQRRLYEAILTNTPDFAYVFSLDHRFTYANEGLRRMFGERWDSSPNKTFLEVGYPEWHAALHSREIDEVVVTRQPIRGEVPFEGTFGRRIYDYIFVPVLNGEGEVEAVAGTTRDVTDRRQAEKEREALLASERAARSAAERTGRVKDEFLATLSHELRTPLNAILGWTYILTQKESVNEVVAHGLAVIHRNAHLQAQLIADLLDMSRIISGKMRLEVQRVDLPAVILAALDSVRPAAEAKGIRIQSVLGTIAEPFHGDSARLQQIVWNLVSNAVKFTPQGGRVEVGLARTDAMIEVTVSDTGSGIDPTFLPFLFERFRQADSSVAREHGGLGLGLAIVKQLVELHGGSVRVSSAGEGQGSTFTIQLPLTPLRPDSDEGSMAAQQEAPSAPTPKTSRSLAGISVLMVDDEADARELVKRLLEECGAEVILADSAESAVQALELHEPDVILSDIGMPKNDGYALMRRIRRAGLRVPAVAITAFARSEDRTRALQAGYQTHLTKPFEPPELIAAVAALAHKTQFPREPDLA